MKKFQFRLEAVERHRKLTEQEKQVWLAKCVEKLRSTEQKLLDLDMKEVQARREFAALGSVSKDPSSARFWVLDQFIQGQKIRRVELKKQRETEEQEVALAYRQFLKARQERKIMEKLREKRFAQYREESRKQEVRQQDEQYVMRAKLFVNGLGESNEE
jgi:flagellar FliJ protein